MSFFGKFASVFVKFFVKSWLSLVKYWLVSWRVTPYQVGENRRVTGYLLILGGVMCGFMLSAVKHQHPLLCIAWAAAGGFYFSLFNVFLTWVDIDLTEKNAVAESKRVLETFSVVLVEVPKILYPFCGEDSPAWEDFSAAGERLFEFNMSLLVSPVRDWPTAALAAESFAYTKLCDALNEANRQRGVDCPPQNDQGLDPRKRFEALRSQFTIQDFAPAEAVSAGPVTSTTVTG